jgi:uncharacterized iron-regulated membrane protein
MKVRTYRKFHRWLGIVVGVQLLFWTASGLFFALNPIERVRGESEQAEPPSLGAGVSIASPDAALDSLRAIHGDVEVLSVLLRPHLETAVYEISFRSEEMTGWALADTTTGRLRNPVGRDEAVALALADFSEPVEIEDVVRLTTVESDSEYRGRPLPAYRVDLAHPFGTRIYVSEERGVVTARRNDRWRWFDFFWMLHIMDYDERDDFNTPILKVAAGLGVITVLSGFVLAGMTSPRLRRLFGERRRD